MLHDRFLGASRPLGEARVLWEIGPEGADVRALRSRLDLDSGYLSRVLRALEAAGLVTVGPSRATSACAPARLTRAGRRERALLDARSDELAASFLEPLDERTAGRASSSSMREVERLLTARAGRDHPDGSRRPRRAVLHRGVLRRARRALRRGLRSGAEHLAPTPTSCARRPVCSSWPGCASQPIGCGALKFHRRAPTEIKRMWVAPSARGLGVGRKLLADARAARRASTDAAPCGSRRTAPHRSDRDVPRGGLRRGRRVQRRAVRPPLVREAAQSRERGGHPVQVTSASQVGLCSTRSDAWSPGSSRSTISR